MRCLELFAGIGGFSVAFPNATVVHAVDIDRDGRAVYEANFSYPYKIAEISSLSTEWFREQQADFWWMSPPCTPFTRRGNERDLSDRRSDAIKHLIDVVAEVRPIFIGIENVIGFETSDAFRLLNETWTSAGYTIDWLHLCPSQLGWPNRRPRFYAIASLESSIEAAGREPSGTPFKAAGREPSGDGRKTCFTPPPPDISSLLEPTNDQTIWLSPEIANRYASALDTVTADSIDAITACFTASYGKAIIRSGSYLKTDRGLRRFSPREVARFLGFPDEFRFPEELSTRRLWHLLGNSLSIPAVQFLFGGSSLTSNRFNASRFCGS